MKGKRLFINTVLMTVTSLFLRTLGLIFQVYLSNRIGTAGIGLWSLILSVNMFAATLAISGIRFAATRLVSEELGQGRGRNIPAVVRRCLGYAAFFGLLASCVIFFAAEPIGTGLIGDFRTVAPLKLLALSLPFLSMGAVLGGYFTGENRVGKSAAVSVLEQLIRMAVSVWLLSLVPAWDVEGMCCAVVLGGVAGEILSFFGAYLLYLRDKRQYDAALQEPEGLTKRMLAISMPLAVSAYARTALTTVQNLLVPMGLRRSGASAEEALSGYGMIQGMVFPVITFPQVIFSSLSELLVPELTEEQVRGNDDRIAASANALLTLCFLFSAGVMGALWCFSRELGLVIYQSAEVGRFIRLLAPLMPIMYMDSVTDGMLRGLGQHLYSMRINIVDSLLSTALVWLILPKFAVYGYVFILYASEIFNFTLSMRKLSQITSLWQSVREMARALLGAAAAASFVRLLFNLRGGATGAWGVVGGIVLFAAVYIVLLRLLNAVSRRKLGGMLAALR